MNFYFKSQFNINKKVGLISILLNYILYNMMDSKRNEAREGRKFCTKSVRRLDFLRHWTRGHCTSRAEMLWPFSQLEHMSTQVIFAIPHVLFILYTLRPPIRV